MIQKEISGFQKKTKELAEFFGIISGDGHLFDKGRVHRIAITLNLTEDFKYVNYVIDLIKKLFNVKSSLQKRESEHTYNVIVHSKVISKFISSLGFPNGKKKNKLRIPVWVCKNKDFIYLFLRGLIDTDGSLFFAKRGTYKLNQYPVIELKFSDEQFVNDISNALKKIDIEHIIINHDNDYKIQINGKYKIEKWAEKIGFKNFNLITRYIMWKRFGYCPPKTNLKERIEILNMREWQNGHALDFLKGKGEPAEL